MTDVTIYYEAQERAMATGIAGSYDAWPNTIPAPHTKNGRLKKMPREFADSLAARDKVIALAVELARKMLGSALFDDTARELLALAEAVKVQA